MLCCLRAWVPMKPAGAGFDDRYSYLVPMLILVLAGPYEWKTGRPGSMLCAY